MAKKKPTPAFLLCVNNQGYPASLEQRKVYRAIPDRASEARGYVRVIDESGEDYLYPATCFVPIELPRAAAGAFAESAGEG